MDLIITLDRRQGFGQEGDWVPLVIVLGLLGENGSCSKFGAVCFNPEGTRVVWGGQDWS